jgi:hypothetical protein
LQKVKVEERLKDAQRLYGKLAEAPAQGNAPLAGAARSVSP